MSTVSFNLPDSVHKKIQELADREGISVDQFLATAAAEKLAAFTAWSIWSSVRPVAAANNCSASSIVFRTCHPIRVTSSDNNGVLRKTVFHAKTQSRREASWFSLPALRLRVRPIFRSFGMRPASGLGL